MTSLVKTQGHHPLRNTLPHTLYCVASHICLPHTQIDTLESGEIDYAHLTVRLEANKDRPAILNVNIGTTVKGAVDDLDRILDILESTGARADALGGARREIVCMLTSGSRRETVCTC